MSPATRVVNDRRQGRGARRGGPREVGLPAGSAVRRQPGITRLFSRNRTVEVLERTKDKNRLGLGWPRTFGAPTAIWGEAFAAVVAAAPRGRTAGSGQADRLADAAFLHLGPTRSPYYQSMSVVNWTSG